MISFNTTSKNFNYIYRAMSGGSVFSENLAGQNNFDLFDDSPQINDAIYFGITSFWLDIDLDIGTPLQGSDVVLKWEYYNAKTNSWIEIPYKQDDTNGLTQSGIFRFGCPENWAYMAVNGQNAFWVRVRLESFSSITEGGAVGSNTPTARDGYVNVDDYTESNPASFTDISDYLEANYSYLGKIKIGSNLFDFKRFGVKINSPLLTKQEVVIMGYMTHYDSRCANRGPKYRFDYIRAGEKTIDSEGNISTRHGSEFIVYGRSWGDPILRFNKFSKLYNSKIRTGKWDNGYETAQHIGYPVLGASEIIDCVIEGLAPNMSNQGGGHWENVIYRKDTFLLNGFPVVFKNVRVIITNSLFYIYNVGATARDFDYVFDKGVKRSLFLFYNSWNNVEINFVNPKKSLPSIFDSPSSVYRHGVPNPNQFPYGNTFLKVFYYDASEDTYTDYTNEASDETAGNVPLYGDVGDIWYFQVPDNSGWKILGIRVDVKVPNDSQENDYIYQWEEARGGWKAYRKVWDLTNGFKKSGSIYLQRNLGNYYLDKLTINGVSGYWIRLKIIQKGTKTPEATLFKGHGEGGIADNAIYEKYSLTLKVIDKDGNPIENAIVKIYKSDDLSNPVSTQTTDSEGEIEEVELTKKIIGFSPIDYYDNPYQMKEETIKGYKIIITKAGYQKYEMDVSLNKKTELVIALNKQVKVFFDMGKPVINLQPSNPSNKNVLSL